MSNRTPIQTDRARGLRSAQTLAEERLWQRLRAGRLNGYKFVRQHPVGTYVVDFACRAERLVVEIDGATHGEAHQIARDARRTDFLGGQGYRVLRFQNHEIADNLHGVCETILAALERRGTL